MQSTLADRSLIFLLPRARVEVATDSFDVVAHELDPSEREVIIPKINATPPRVRLRELPVKNHAYHPRADAAGAAP
jgi:hypothetical protein